jgi:hypothetical protein
MTETETELPEIELIDLDKLGRPIGLSFWITKI